MTPPKLESALYQGTIRHRRFGDRSHRFSYPLFMLYVDLEELKRAFSGSRLWSASGPAVAWLRRADYFGDPKLDWADVVRDRVEQECGLRSSGSVRLLTHVRTFGIRMNPVSFYYCFDKREELEAVVAEITNTPWGERHLYVVHREQVGTPRSSEVRSDRNTNEKAKSRSWEVSFDKSFHVSPFLPMDMRYRWMLEPPDGSLFFHMENHRDGEKVLDATLALKRMEITHKTLRRALVRYPFMTLRIIFWIYLQAAYIKLKGVRFHAHPKSLKKVSA